MHPLGRLAEVFQALALVGKVAAEREVRAVHLHEEAGAVNGLVFFAHGVC